MTGKEQEQNNLHSYFGGKDMDICTQTSTVMQVKHHRGTEEGETPEDLWKGFGKGDGHVP